uniref:hypothetical protein n=1 Tax=Marivita sp. TaxID=2003365 RepID=UPI0025C40680
WRISLSQDIETIGSTAEFLAALCPMDATRREHVFRPVGRHNNPARAWLIVILEALIAQEDT